MRLSTWYIEHRRKIVLALEFQSKVQVKPDRHDSSSPVFRYVLNVVKLMSDNYRLILVRLLVRIEILDVVFFIKKLVGANCSDQT